MLFDPPVIRVLDDVLPHIKDKPEIVHIQKDDYSVLDYVYSSSTTFDNPFAKECRGLKFDREGILIARPFHKFHNLGENEEYLSENVNLSLPHKRLDKLDGSMVHSCLIDGRWRLMTRKGESEVALKAMAFLEADSDRLQRYTELFNSMLGYTFIFEYVAPHNRIVIFYQDEDLILTAIRHNESGFYINDDIMRDVGAAYKIPIVGFYDNENVSEDDEKEGCVIRFATGAMIKMKSDIYVRKHRSKDLVANFKDLVGLIVNDTLDDILPQLDPDMKKKVVDYRDKLLAVMRERGFSYECLCRSHSSLTQKDFATKIVCQFPKPSQGILYGIRKTGDGLGEVKRCIAKACSDRKRLEQVFVDLYFPIWEGDFFSE